MNETINQQRQDKQRADELGMSYYEYKRSQMTPEELVADNERTEKWLRISIDGLLNRLKLWEYDKLIDLSDSEKFYQVMKTKTDKQRNYLSLLIAKSERQKAHRLLIDFGFNLKTNENN